MLRPGRPHAFEVLTHRNRELDLAVEAECRYGGPLVFQGLDECSLTSKREAHLYVHGTAAQAKPMFMGGCAGQCGRHLLEHHLAEAQSPLEHS